MKNIKLTVAYDGSSFFGWQSTASGPSIESELSQVLTQILQEKTSLQAASRTDRGVHADGQIINFFTHKDLPDLHCLQKSLNALLPPTIRIIQIEEVFLSFHPTLDAQGKLYRYLICWGDLQLPQYRNYSWHVPYCLDLEQMEEAANLLTGVRDFSAFCNQRKNLRDIHQERELFSVSIHPLSEKRLVINVSGNHFLYKMVRNIVGTLVYIGRKKILPESLSNLIDSKDRTLLGMTAPAHGLCLKQVFYPQKIEL